MNQFAILEADYCSIETHVGDELEVFKATHIVSDAIIRVCTSSERSPEDDSVGRQFIDAEHRMVSVTDAAVVLSEFISIGRYEPRPYLISTWWDSSLADSLTGGATRSTVSDVPGTWTTGPKLRSRQGGRSGFSLTPRVP